LPARFSNIKRIIKSPIIYHYVEQFSKKIVSFFKTIFRVDGKRGKSGTKIVFGVCNEILIKISLSSLNKNTPKKEY